MMRALIVDDEIYARQELETLLKETGEFIVAGKCANALEAMQAINKEKPDVLFLDVQMPAINGFELLSMIDEAAMPLVVFVTAYDEYALKAFEENALDYLLKPVEKGRLAKTVEKLKKRFAEGSRPIFAGPAIQKVPCIHSSKIKLINTAEIEYVRSSEGGVHVILPAGELYTELTLQVLENRTELVRCHKQFLINIDLVDEIILRENMLADIKTKSGHLVPVSRRYLRVLREKLHF
jgi:two-component system, LytTR family, response regulator